MQSSLLFNGAAGQESNSGTSTKRSLSVVIESQADDTCDEELAHDDNSVLYHTEKKRRLSAEQVRSLEMSFGRENRLEPDRKLQLAKELGLQPRQVAIWFQNRRARWKTKQLERDYDILKAAYDSLVCEKEKLQAEIVSLSVKLQAGCKEIVRGDHSNADDQSNSDVKPCKPVKDKLYLSENSLIEQSGEYWELKQRPLSPVSSFDALSDSNGRSRLINNSLEKKFEGRAACSSYFTEAGFDQKAVLSLQAFKFDIVDPAHQLLVTGDESFGIIRNTHGRQHIICKLEDSFEKESYIAPIFTTLDENGCWPWYWES